ncbi:MAG: MFS transporter [Nakamurella sp.]
MTPGEKALGEKAPGEKAPRTAPTKAFASGSRGVLIGLLALVTMFAFEAIAVSLVMPTVTADLNGESLYPIAVVGLLTASIVGMVVSGSWCDARGAGVPLILGGALFVLGLTVSGISTSMLVFVAGRLLQGLGAGTALTAMYVAVGEAFAPALRPRVFSLFTAAWVLPAVVGPVIAGLLVDLAGWRSVFLVVAGFAAVSVIGVRVALAGRLVRRSAPVVWGRRPWYAVAAAVGVVLLHLAGQRAGGDAVVPVVVLLVVAVVVLVVAVPRLLPVGTFRCGRGLPSVIVLRGLAGGAFVSVETFLPLVLQRESGLTPTLAGLVMTTGALGWTAAAVATARAGRPETYTRLMTGGAVALLLGGLVLLALVPLDHLVGAAVAVAIVGFTLMATGMGMAMPLMSTLALDLAPGGRQGDSAAAVQMSDSLGQSVAAGVIGVVFARWFLLDRETSYLAGFGLAVLLAAGAVAVVRRTRV